MLIQYICHLNEYYSTEKIFKFISMAQYQCSIFYAQWYQMNDKSDDKLTGLNVWFIIEIITFYGYIISAIWFLAESQIRSSCGKLNKTHMQDRHKFDVL